MAELGPDVWSPQGEKILGTPVGSAEFIEEATQRRLEEERILWDAIPSVPDIQYAWQILLQCAGPRCHHWLRTVPESCSATYAVGHDVGMMNKMDALLGGLPRDAGQKEMAHTLASLPMRLGGLRLRSAARMAPAAFWASWADALPMIAERLPAAADHVEAQLAEDGAPRGSVGESKECTRILDHAGFVGRPSWAELRGGRRALASLDNEPGEWHHGWQYHASSASEHHFRESMVFRQSCAALGRHRAACPRSGRLRDTGRPARENNGTHLQGGRSHSAVQHAIARDERRRIGQ